MPVEETDSQITSLNETIRKQAEKIYKLERIIKLNNKLDEKTPASMHSYCLRLIPYTQNQVFDMSDLTPKQILSGGKTFPQCFGDRVKQVMKKSSGTVMTSHLATIFFVHEIDAKNALGALKVCASAVRSELGKFRHFRTRKTEMLVHDEVFPVN